MIARRTRRWFRRSRRLVAVVAAVVVVGAGAGGIAVASGGSNGNVTHLTAYFKQTVGLYNGNDVRILGIKVGKIDKLTVEGNEVKAELTLNGKNKLPAGVTAVIIPPSLVSDRYIELQPAYTSGPTLANDAVLSMQQTQVPLEYDEIFKNLDQLNVALGPQGANRKGALARLIAISDKNLKGNGTELNSALGQFSQAISTLAGSRNDLFGTVSALQQFTTTIAHDDGGVRALNANLAQVGQQLEGDRKDLGEALGNLATALSLVNTFVAENRNKFTDDVHRLTKVSQVLQDEKTAITQLVDLAGEAVTNLSLAGDPKVATQQSVNGIGVEPLDTKADLTVPATSSGQGNAACQLFQAIGGVTNPIVQLICAEASAAGGQSSAKDLPKGKSLAQLLAVIHK